MFLMRISAVLLACSLPAAAFAAPAQPQPPKPGEERPDDVICETVTPIGSHIKRRVCATRQAREEKTKADQELMKRQTTRGSGKAGGDPGGL